MADTAAPGTPDPRPFTVESIKSIGNGLWQLAVIAPNGDKVYAVLSFNNLTLQNVLLTAEAIGVLHATKNGATPVIQPF